MSFMLSVEYQEIGRFDDSVSYDALLADFTNEFHDLRKDSRFGSCLDPRSYVASQRLAARLLETTSVGVIYPSVRRSRGINLACFRPAIVGNVWLGERYRFSWEGTPTPKIQLDTRLGKNR